MISIYDWFGYDLTIDERYRLIKKAGFDGVMLWWSNGFGRDIHGWNNYRKGPQIARENGLFVENIHAPVENQNNLWLDNIDGEALLNCYIKCILECEEFEIPTVVIHLPNEDYKCNALGLDRINKIAEKAEKHKINVAFENLRNLANIKQVLEKVESERIGFCYDSGHHIRRYEDYDMLAEYGSRLMALHLHDNNGEHAQHGLPFDGTLDWNKIMRNIEVTNYKGSIGIEVMNWEYIHISADEFLREAFNRAKILEELMLILR
ncbi:sugar phosphate isomerase/epimerase [Sedimentibacter sp. zth1]|uniref:sugar phosphate isomerase/epimerase family protein n=1 Tax=Sedimentibacter sp. zth1 TaxID=2816908 RepID=UPI001A91E57C|nr:sugar phosphate isomerase/epimerase family protein [Sedimentibacter sp. zth1]QSX04673.1 sugar phosphate isomerase/epimerase [Sedimentibacter sp. zth1]